MRYNTDLFDPAIIARISGHFETLLRHAVEHPDTRLNALKELLAETDRQERAQIRKEHRELNIRKLQQVKRKALSASHLDNDGVPGKQKYTNANGRY
jgi:non-ribosomal peptide synthetase component F